MLVYKFLQGQGVNTYYTDAFVDSDTNKVLNNFVVTESRETSKDIISAGVNILTAYGAIFLVRPQNTRFDTKIQDGPTEYRVENAGNSTIVLDDFKDCSIKKESDCHATKKHHVRPGESFIFTKDSGRRYEFNLVEGGSVKKTLVK